VIDKAIVIFKKIYQEMKENAMEKNISKNQTLVNRKLLKRKESCLNIN
jgi:hypothetical protein